MLAPRLDNHQPNSLNHVLGSAVSARMEDSRGLATIKLSTRKEVAGAILDLKDGIITEISVGYKYEQVAAKERPSGWNVSSRLAVAPAWPAEPVGVTQPARREMPAGNTAGDGGLCRLHGA